jgi:hypothetical protein
MEIKRSIRLTKMTENNINKKLDCPEGFKECVAHEMFSLGVGITIEKTGDSYAILNNQQEFLGQIYCSNPVPCISKYGVKCKRVSAMMERN